MNRNMKKIFVLLLLSFLSFEISAKTYLKIWSFYADNPEEPRKGSRKTERLWTAEEDLSDFLKDWLNNELFVNYQTIPYFSFVFPYDSELRNERNIKDIVRYISDFEIESLDERLKFSTGDLYISWFRKSTNDGYGSGQVVHGLCSLEQLQLYKKAKTSISEKIKIDMVKIPGRNLMMAKTEITQLQYKAVMGRNPSWHSIDNDELSIKEKMTFGKNTDNYPVEQVSWYDAIYFCNKLSEINGLQPVYSVNGQTDVRFWNYSDHNIKGDVKQIFNANGYRLPTEEEWIYGAKGGENYKYSGSNNLNEVGWNMENSEYITHPVGTKKPNAYGLYDMSGNVFEWCWDTVLETKRVIRGGCKNMNTDYCSINFQNYCSPDWYTWEYYMHGDFGFRVVRSEQ